MMYLRTKARITFREDDVSKADEILRPFGFRASRSSFIHLATVFDDEDRYGELILALKERKIDYRAQCEKVFDSNELTSAEYLLLTTTTLWGYPQPEEEFGYRAASFDMRVGCPQCGKSAKQVKPLMVKSDVVLGKRDITAIFSIYEIIVSGRLQTLIESAGLTGAEFWPLLKYKSGEPGDPMVGYHQLYVNSILPPASSTTIFPVVALPRGLRPCSCGRTGRNWPENQFRYNQSDLTAAKDFNKTHEWLGGGLDTAQLKIVSHRVYELFFKNKIRGVNFEPVILEDRHMAH
jgi:hypothetical protein